MVYWVTVLVLFVPMILWRGFVLLKLWGWFILPLGAPQIGMAHALGLALVVSVLTYEYYSTADSNEKWDRMIGAFLMPAWALGFGWLYQGWL